VSTSGNSTKPATVVVGVDGSAGSIQALRWALAEARLRNAPLRIVHAWSYVYADAAGGGYGAMGGFGSFSALGVDVGDLHRAAFDLIQNAIDRVGRDIEGMDVERLIVQGNAADALVDAAAADDILVVGSRGYGGFAGLLLGSVSQRCVHRAACPVVVVHAPSDPAGDDPDLTDAIREDAEAPV